MRLFEIGDRSSPTHALHQQADAVIARWRRGVDIASLLTPLLVTSNLECLLGGGALGNSGLLTLKSS